MASDRKTYFLLKRLHSLCGLVPVGVFVAFHLFENMNSLRGAAAYNEATATLRSLPLLYVIECCVIWIPIAFHALLGVYLMRQARYNVESYGTRANLAYTLQRATGIILLLFIAYHLYETRFAGIPADRMYQTLAADYANPLIFWFYVAGILSAAFHLSNGLWSFSISWGLVPGQKAQDMVWKGCMVLGAVVAFMGINALLGFTGHGILLFQPRP